MPGGGWTLYTVNCRSNHVHVIVAGDREPKEIREPFKAWCTRRLKALQQERLRPLSAHDSSAAAIRQKWWAERGNALYVNDEEGLEAVIHYVREAQDHADQPQPDERERASRDAVNRPRETLGDSHLISSDPRSRFGLVCDLLCCRGNTLTQKLKYMGLDPTDEKLVKLVVTNAIRFYAATPEQQQAMAAATSRAFEY